MVVCYCADRNLYSLLPTSINSLLSNNQQVEKIYLLIEDEEIPFITDPRVIFINCKEYDFLIKDFNCTRQFPYMAMVRCFLAKILEQEDKVLYLDVDTVVDKNIEELWNLSFQGKCLIARIECRDYFNSGVLVMNLKQIRAMHTEETIGKLLKTCRFIFPDQDALNFVYKSLFVPMPHKFNVLGRYYQVNSMEIAIRHFAGITKPWCKEATKFDKKFWNKYKTDKI